MKLHARLPKDRTAEGSIWVTGDNGALVTGPERCRGKADNREAIAHGNPTRDPLRSFGDHPTGVYRVVEVDRIADLEQRKHFGHVFLKLRPVSGQAFAAHAEHSRTGFGIHGGPLLADGKLRPTNGCLRVEDGTADRLAALVDVEFSAARDVFYEATEEALTA